jgi:hypothetical protein
MDGSHATKESQKVVFPPSLQCGRGVGASLASRDSSCEIEIS